VIPGNDDAIRAIQLYANAVADAVLEAKGASAINPSDFVEAAAPEQV
jgi:small subunit ribosomal protein S2